jgi:Resolvase, N terminal domain
MFHPQTASRPSTRAGQLRGALRASARCQARGYHMRVSKADGRRCSTCSATRWWRPASSRLGSTRITPRARRMIGWGSRPVSSHCGRRHARRLEARPPRSQSPASRQYHPRAHGAQFSFRVLTGQGANIDTTTANGRLVFGIFAALAEFERELIRERTVAGLL